ncbi:MAG: Gfo/Idh/MocA family oxidoreductase [Candidatus Latescibacterota bacterium]
MIELAMIGCGGMGHHHARIFSRMPAVRITGVCDLIADKAKSVAEITGAPWTQRFDEVLGDCQAVWVCTEPFNRLEIVTAAAQAGKHIFTEKPICLDPAQADAMIAAAERAGVVYMLGYVLRFTQPFRIMRDCFAAGQLGQLVSVWTRRWFHVDMREGRWYGHQAQSGGVVLDLASHDLNWMQWIGGPVASVYCRTGRTHADLDADEHGQVMLAFAGGGTGHVETSWWPYLGESHIGIVGTTGAIIASRDGKVRRRLEGGEEEELDVAAATAVNLSGDLATSEGQRIDDLGGQSETIQEHFVRCVAEGREPIASGRDGRRTLAVWKAAMESARTGQSVAVGC